MLWTKQSEKVIKQVIEQVLIAGRLQYEADICEIDQFREGSQRGPMEGTVTRTRQMKSDGTWTQITQGGGSGGYLRKYCNGAWNNGDSEYQPAFLPFIPRVIDLVSTLFHRPPVLRGTIDGKEVTGQDQAKVQELLSETKFARKGKAAQKRAAAFRVVFAMPRWFRNRISIDLINPDKLYVEEDPLNPGVFEDCLAVAHRLPETADGIVVSQTKWLVWERAPQADGTSKWWVFYCDANGRVLPNPYFSDNINPYVCFPHVPLYCAEWDQIFPPVDDSLVNAQVSLNLAWTHIMSLVRRAGGTPFFAGFQDKINNDFEILLGENHAVNSPNPDAKFSYVEMRAQFSELIATATHKLKLDATFRGIPGDAFDVSTSSAIDALSAASKAMDRLDLIEVRQDQETIWEEQLEELWESVVTVWNAHCLPSQKINPEIELSVTWAQPELPVSRQEQAQAAQIEIKENISTPVDFIQARDKCSREKALEIYEANKEINGATAMPTVAPPVAQAEIEDPEDPEDPEEQDGNDDRMA